MKNVFKKLLGSDGENGITLAKKEHEARVLKQNINKDIFAIKKKVDRLNTNTNIKLNEISTDLKSITYVIAIASGGKRRGLK